MTRICEHPILGDLTGVDQVTIIVDGKPYPAHEGEMIAAALLANDIKTFRYTAHQHRPRGIYCGIGRCTDCIMTVDGIPNIRTCITPVRDGMVIETQYGVGEWKRGDHHE
ncbi:MAG: dehydrogenase [Anaerosolibacter sp.]|uniref:(2Fe-2S)-binding protein n=1 Tax=Anaerosolibacter sp. TaxID=1872527 RepID=UPI002605EC17|nr:(2Fe-2S)-binding protein [Anaerosolibacter sp.]MDF2548482.1 dehydrogenase [Anaerosolibacter sp.]